MTLLVILVFAGVQDDAVRPLVEKLRSDRVEEREEATRKLRKLGRAAAGELETLAADKDNEVALRAKFLLRIIDLRETLPPALIRELPGIEERLAGEDPRAWTEAFLEAADESKHPSLRALDLLPLFGPAARGARRVDDKRSLLLVVAHRSLTAAAPDVAALLEDADERVRMLALRALKGLGGLEALPAILARFKDPEPAIRSAAAETVGEMSAVEAALQVLLLLDDPEADVRGAALDALKLIGHAGFGAKVARLLKDGDDLVVAAAAGTLAAFGAREHAPDLLPLLENPRELVKMEAVRALARLRHREAIPAVAKSLRDVSDGVRRAAALALGTLGARDRAPEIVPLLQDNFEHVREAAALALGELGAPEGAEAMARLLREERDAVVARVVRAFMRLPARQAVPAVEGLLHGTWPAREAGLEILAALRSDACLQPAARFLRDPECTDRALAAFALRRAGADGVKELIRALDSEDVLVRVFAADELGAAGHADAASKLRPLLDSRRPAEVRAAARSLAEVRAREAIPDLVRRLSDTEGEERAAIAEALRDLGAAEAVPELILRAASEGVFEAIAVLSEKDLLPAFRAALQSPDWKVRAAAVERAGRQRATAAIPDLRALLEDPELRVRGPALEALGRLRDLESLDALRKALRDSDPTLRNRAARSLGRLGARGAIGDLVEMLDQDRAEIGLAAAEALSRVGAREIAPELRKLHARTSFEDRTWTGLSLARLGYPEGIRWIFQEGQELSLLPLNAHRNSFAWNRFRSHGITEPVRGTPAEILERLGQEAGFAIEWIEDPFPGHEQERVRRTWRTRRFRIGALSDGSTLVEALEDLLEESPYEAIFDGGRIRILPRERAAAFWASWWEELRQ